MHCITFILLSLTPSFLFSVAALPVERYSTIQQFVLILIYIINLGIPVYYGGLFGRSCGMVMGVWAWANGLKMAVWLFCMPQEERRKRPFFGTLFYWRERANKPKKSIDVVKPEDKQKLQEPSKDHSTTNKLDLYYALTSYLRDHLIFETLDMILLWIDGHQKSIVVFEQAVRMLVFQGPTVSMGWSEILSSFILCTLFSIHLQLQLQVTYSSFVLIFSIAYKFLPFLGIKTKRMQTVKGYLEEASTMAPAFESPWEATSLRDYWSNRWHQFYNSCFVRLTFLPLRRLCGNFKVLRRIIPVWGVFALSGLMHEYFLICTTGPRTYFYGGAAGWQMLFFLLQPIGIQMGDAIFRPGWPGRTFAIGWMIMLSHLFVVPYFLSDYFDVVILRTLPAVLKYLDTYRTALVGNIF
ncbi:hypothetical protein INT45_005618 [Circinella minor]|uniref:Wax synthase domain-containing protein n=1 Tax=Circinella minor TaxID=1195481 RepID=A0A8H7S816_9FUNG|nr:hypothetical protein INT45_005618 [Circinella minor]